MAGTVKMVAPLELGLCVSDLDRALAFYQGGLGLEFVSRIETLEAHAMASGFCHSGYEVVRLQFPTGERIKLFAPAKPPLPRERHGQPPLSVVGFAYITLIVESLPACLAMLGARGILPRPPGIYTLRPAVEVALVDDPDFNVVELVSYGDIASYRTDIPLPAQES